MRVFLDSSFFFPFIGVAVRECPRTAILDLLARADLEISRSELVLFEISAKGVKYTNAGMLTMQDVTDGLNVIVNLSALTVVPFYFAEIQELAATIRQDHADFIDCLTIASALHYADAFVTLDGELIKKTRDRWQEEFARLNPQFTIVHWDEFHARFP